MSACSELEIAASHWHLAGQIQFARPNLLYISTMEKPLIVHSNVPTFKEWLTNFKLLLQALVFSK